MNVVLARSTLAALCRIVLGSSIMIGLASGPQAIAGGGGGHGGGFGGGRMGGGGFGWGRGGRMGGGYYGPGGYGYGGFGGFGFGRIGLRYGMSGMGYGYGYPGYSLGYSGYGYGSYPGYVYGSGYTDPVSTHSSPGYIYSSAYGTVPLQAAAQSSFPLPSLGIDERKVSDATGSHIQVVRIHAGSPAERAGLQAGDKIVSVNGFLTQDPGNLAWIINHHTSNGAVTLKVRQVANGQDATLTATLH
jgi:hypothetical protein